MLRERLKLEFSRIAGESIAELRASMDKCYTALLAEPPGVIRAPVSADGVDAEWFRPGGKSAKVLLYLHGGGFAMGSTISHGAFIGELAVRCDIDALGINYRRPPEHPFPAAIEDALTAYCWLLGQGIEPQAIALAGDSAGGGLAASLLLDLRDAGLPQPGCAVLISPWADLTHSGGSISRNAGRDPICQKPGSDALARMYANGRILSDPRLSPVFGSWEHVCPLLIMAGDTEIFMDDAVRIADKARAAGGHVDLSIGLDCIHVWPQFSQLHQEGADAVGRIAQFIDANLGLQND